MKPQTLKETLIQAYGKKRPICIEGAPGGGKTTIVREVAAELGIGYIEKHMPTMLVEDFGMPWPTADDTTFQYKLPDWFPAEERDDIPDNGILCFDDRNQSGPDLQKVLANIQQARNLHNIKLKKGWSVVSTGNRQSDRAGSNRVLSHLRDRETMIPLDVDLNDWTAWALANDVEPEVISFIRFRPGLLHDFDANRDVNATPRSWVEGVSDVLGIVPEEAEMEFYGGSVGEGAAAEFLGFLRVYQNLPDPQSIFLNPKNAEVPEKPEVLYALSGALSHHASPDNMEALLQYLDRIPPEFSVLTVSQAIVKTPEITTCMAFSQWAVSNKSVMF